MTCSECSICYTEYDELTIPAEQDEHEGKYGDDYVRNLVQMLVCLHAWLPHSSGSETKS